MPRGDGKPSASEVVTVLVVDDVEDTRDMYAEYLRFKGYVVDTAVNGIEGLTKSAEALPTVVIADLTMPGIDGFTFIRELRNRPTGPQPYVIVVSGHALKGTAEQALAAGADLFLSKPCLPDELEAEIRKRASARRRESRRRKSP